MYQLNEFCLFAELYAYIYIYTGIHLLESSVEHYNEARIFINKFLYYTLHLICKI